MADETPWYNRERWYEDNKSRPPSEGEASPRPWRINPAWEFNSDDVHALGRPPILDANDQAVFDTSEWMTISPKNAELIVRAVNALPPD